MPLQAGLVTAAAKASLAYDDNGVLSCFGVISVTAPKQE